jgi:hypothetical protein
MGIKSLSLLAGCLITGGCATPYTDHARELESQMRQVVLEDGINESEANVIARSYFHRFGPGCGGVADVFEDDKFWVGRTAVGVAGIPTPEPIRIDKQTGRVTWGADDPTIDDPRKLWWWHRHRKQSPEGYFPLVKSSLHQ